MTSCVDDLSDVNPNGIYSDDIRFGMISGARTRLGAESGGDGHTTGNYVLRTVGSSDTLCLKASVSDGIGSPYVRTRGAAVTADNFYDNFGVLGMLNKSDGSSQLFMPDETVTDQGSNTWGCQNGNVYYWPGASYTLDFYAYAPKTADGMSTNVNEKSLKYTVPQDVTRQMDLLTAESTNMSGNSNTIVPLKFRHICTAVRFVVGDDMQNGTLKSISLKGVNGSGIYSLTNNSWTLDNTTADFSQQPETATTPDMDPGTLLTPEENLFMMLPQTLPADASLEVVFADGVSNRDRTFSMSLADMEWLMGKTVTYRLSVTPDYDLHFLTDNQVQDAHYVMYPIVISAQRLEGKNWSVSIDGNPDWIDMKWNSDLIDLERQGFWIDNTDTNYKNKRSSLLTKTGDGQFVLYAFLKENITGSDRIATLSVKIDGRVVDQYTIIQKSAVSVSGKYVELFDDRVPEGYNLTDDSKPVPWGFAWNASDNEHYVYVPVSGGGSGTNIPQGWLDKLKAALTSLGLSYTDDPNATNSTVLIPGKKGGVDIYINLSSFTNLGNVAQSDIDGLTNTWEIYSMDGIGDLGLITQLLNIFPNVQPANGTTNEVVNPTQFAAYSALKKNKFNLKSSTVTAPDGSSIVVLEPVITKEQVKWYLPACNEYSGLNNLSDYGLNGAYWTSTAINTGNNMTNAYMFSNGVKSSEPRANEHKIRAMRTAN